MPTQAPHPCAAPGCPALVERGRYCPQHAPQYVAPHEAARATASERGYGARWRRLRTMALSRNPICADPWGVHAKAGQVIAAVDVDHILPRSQGGQDVLENLQGLCHACHSRKTVMSDGGFGRETQAGDDEGRGNQISGAFEAETARRAFRTRPQVSPGGYGVGPQATRHPRSGQR
jgi:5-methylcytosine-specific restriction protein A